MIVPREFELELRLRPVMDTRNGMAAKKIQKKDCVLHILAYTTTISQAPEINLN